MVKNNPLKDSFKESAFSSKDEFIKPEDIDMSALYAITYNPKDQPDLALSQGFIDWWLDQKKLLTNLRGCNVRLFLEISKTGRHHFHGFIKITNRVKFAVYDTPKLQKEGSTCIKPIAFGPDENKFDHFIEWFAYCLKLQNDMQDYIHDQITPVFKKNNINADSWLTINNL